MIKCGDHPDVFRKSKEAFFEQLKEIKPKKYEWIKELYDNVKQNDDFEVKWGGKKRWSTMRFYVTLPIKKPWNVNPISVYGNGKIEISYQGNPAIFPWELPQETKTELHKIFKNPKQKPWHYIPLETRTDLDNIYYALKILAEHSKRFDIGLHKKKVMPSNPP